jgi:hypothetical protein
VIDNLILKQVTMMPYTSLELPDINKIPTKPGIYLCRHKKRSTWDSLLKVSGEAPFLKAWRWSLRPGEVPQGSGPDLIIGPSVETIGIPVVETRKKLKR